MRYLLPKLRPGMPASQFGLMVTPHMPVAYEVLADYDWAADNQVFTGHFQEGKFFEWLRKLKPYRARCLFVTVPDLVADCQGTLARWEKYQRRIQNMGFRTAFVCQNGQEPADLPTDQEFTDWCEGREDLIDDDGTLLLAGIEWVEQCLACDCLFIGGTTEWKLGPEAASLIRFARRLGKSVHIGRVNSGERFQRFQLLGADTCDGTSICFAPDENYKKIEGWTRQPALLTL